MFKVVIAFVFFVSSSVPVLAQATPEPFTINYTRALEDKGTACNLYGVAAKRVDEMKDVRNRVCLGDLEHLAACAEEAHDPALAELRPDPRHTWILCGIVVRNNSDYTTYVISHELVRLTSQHGTKYPLTLKPFDGDIEMMNPFPLVPPGEISFLVLAFELPADYSLPLFLVIRDPQVSTNYGAFVIRDFFDGPFVWPPQ